MEMTNAPGLSAFNKVERRMYHLSKQLTGVILPHDTFGSHLQNGKTVDSELEKNNFKAAGETLAQIWNDLEIDGHNVKAEYIEKPPNDETINFEVTPKFKSRHVLETQYMVCYLKCDDRSCCTKFRTSVDIFFPNRRIPALIPIKRTISGPVSLKLEPEVYKSKLEFLSPFERILMEDRLVPEELKNKYGKYVPYDCYLPTCQDKVENRTCKVCYKYHATIKSLKTHMKVCKRSKHTNSKAVKKSSNKESFIDSDEDDLNSSTMHNEENQNDDEEIDVQRVRVTYSVTNPGECVETILNLKEWLKSPWQEIMETN